jgi:hypothetical protein
MISVMPRPLASIEAFRLYAAKIGLPEPEAEKAFDFYESNGWKVGRNPMKSWEASLRNWKRTYDERRGAVKQTIHVGTYQEQPWQREKRLKAELEVLRARLFKVGDVSPVDSHERAAQIGAARLPITERIKAVKAELGLI